MDYILQGRIPSRWELKHTMQKLEISNRTSRIPSRWELKHYLKLPIEQVSFVEFHPVGN